MFLSKVRWRARVRFEYRITFDDDARAIDLSRVCHAAFKPENAAVARAEWNFKMRADRGRRDQVTRGRFLFMDFCDLYWTCRDVVKRTMDKLIGKFLGN